MLVLALALLVVAIAVGIWVIGSTADEKSVVRASLRQLDGYQVDNVRDAELLKPVGERTVQPLQERLVEIGKRFTPDGYTDKVRQKMVSAGIQSPDAVDRFIATRAVTVALAPVSFFLVFGVLKMSGMMGLVDGPAAGHGLRPRSGGGARPQDRRAPAPDPGEAPRRARPAGDQRRGRPGVRAGARPHRSPRCRAR